MPPFLFLLTRHSTIHRMLDTLEGEVPMSPDDTVRSSMAYPWHMNSNKLCNMIVVYTSKIYVDRTISSDNEGNRDLSHHRFFKMYAVPSRFPKGHEPQEISQ